MFEFVCEVDVQVKYTKLLIIKQPHHLAGEVDTFVIAVVRLKCAFRYSKEKDG